MGIRQARISDFEAVRHIVITTISEIYPHYYPNGAVKYFLEHHSDDNIRSDISQNRVFLCIDLAGYPVGTVTISDNEICRLFVLPDHHYKGYGHELLEFAERYITNAYTEVIIDASLPAKSIYLKRGYKEIQYNIITTENGDHLCYDVMVKKC